MNTSILPLLMLSLAATLSGCASNGMTRSAFLGDYDALEKTKYENVLLFKAPGFEPSRYREIVGRLEKPRHLCDW